MKLPDNLRVLVSERLLAARENYPACLSEDGTAVLVDGGIGYGAYVSPDGDVFMETYDIADDSPTKVDRSTRAQYMALVLGMRTLPELIALLPQRPDDAPDCEACEGSGWRRIGPEIRFICHTCAGLGWLADTNTQDGEAQDI